MKQQQPLLRATPDTPVGAVHKGRGGSRAIRAGRSGIATSHKQPQDGCPRCGKRPKAQCPARDQVCSNCHKRGHYKAVCRSTARVGGIGTSPQEKEGDAFLGAVSGTSDDDPWTVELRLQGRPVTLHIDTGAEVTVITELEWTSLSWNAQIEPCVARTDTLYRPSGSSRVRLHWELDKPGVRYTSPEDSPSHSLVIQQSEILNSSNGSRL